MKKLIIFEGIASSGKTTLEKMLHERISGSAVVTEGETLMPLIENTEPSRAVAHLKELLDRFEGMKLEMIIVDRFHFTHCFRTKSDLGKFVEIERELIRRFLPLVVFLEMGEDAIPDRIRETIERRGSAWAKGKQGALNERVEYYKNQQRVLNELMNETKLPVVRVDTTDKNWERCLNEIITNIEL